MKMKCGLSYLPLPHCLLSPATQPGPGVYDVAVVVFCWGGGGGAGCGHLSVPSSVARAGCSVRILSPLSIK